MLTLFIQKDPGPWASCTLAPSTTCLSSPYGDCVHCFLYVCPLLWMFSMNPRCPDQGKEVWEEALWISVLCGQLLATLWSRRQRRSCAHVLLCSCMESSALGKAAGHPGKIRAENRWPLPAKIVSSLAAFLGTAKRKKRDQEPGEPLCCLQPWDLDWAPSGQQDSCCGQTFKYSSTALIFLIIFVDHHEN